MNPTGGNQNNPNPYHNPGQPSHYGQYNQHQQPGMDYGHHIGGQPPMGQNPNSLPGSSYQPGGYPSNERSQPQHSYGAPPAQSYGGYGHEGSHPPPSYQQSYGGMPPMRPEAGNPNYSSHGGPSMSQPQDSRQNYNSYHEASAPITGGGLGQPSSMGNPGGYGAQPDRNFNSSSQIYGRAEMRHDTYSQPGGHDIHKPLQSHSMGGPGMGGGNEPNLIGGFLGQASNHPPSQMPGQPYSGAHEMSRGGMPDPAQAYQYGGDMTGKGPNMGGLTISGQPPMGSQGSNDPQSMDIGALNRMAEYYATNSDYPKVRNSNSNIL